MSAWQIKPAEDGPHSVDEWVRAEGRGQREWTGQKEGKDCGDGSKGWVEGGKRVEGGERLSEEVKGGEGLRGWVKEMG